jgi:GNAT superfamily N-acetyltransferase
MTNTTIHQVDLANPQHQQALLSLLNHYACDPMGGGQPLGDHARAHLIAGLQSRSNYLGLLAYHHGQPAGLANCFEGYSTFAARPLMNIHDLVVIKGARGKGIGTALLAAIETEARARGCCKLTLEVLSLNTVAKRSYERFGFGGYQLDPSAGQAIFMEKKLP